MNHFYFSSQNTFKSIVPLLEFDGMAAFVNTHRFSSDHRYVPTDPHHGFFFFFFLSCLV